MRNQFRKECRSTITKNGKIETKTFWISRLSIDMKRWHYASTKVRFLFLCRNGKIFKLFSVCGKQVGSRLSYHCFSSSTNGMLTRILICSLNTSP
jgi:hypothetical protein